MRAFLKGIDKRDEKYIINVMTNIEMENSERVIRAGTTERCIILVASGELVAYEGDKNTTYTEGAILGVEQFLFNKPWKEDFICKEQATLCKFSYDDLMDMVSHNALASSRLYKRIVKHFCYSQIYARKQDNMHLFKFKDVEDDQLFIDFKLDCKVEKEQELFKLATQARDIDERNRDSVVSGDDKLKTMPYFLSYQYQAMLDKSASQLAKMRQGELKKSSGGPSSQYKSSFLKDKLEAQNLARKM